MGTNKLLCLAQALTLVAAGAVTCFAVCVATTVLTADLTDVLLASLIAAVFGCTCLVAAMLHANGRKTDAVDQKLQDRDRFAQAVAARVLIAYTQGADNADAEVLQMHQRR